MNPPPARKRTPGADGADGADGVHGAGGGAGQGATPLTRQTAARIVEHIATGGLPEGTRLVERNLADLLKVSRSPVRQALRLLADEGVVAPAARGGFTVALTGEALTRTATVPPAEDDIEASYLRIAADRLDGRLPDRVTENALARRYDLPPGQLAHILRRIAVEGWIDRLPGYGWEFQPMLTSMDAYQDSYRFRLTIEPAAVLEPGFVLDRDALETVRAQQQRLVDGDIWTIGNAQLYDLNSRFHEVVMGCSHNSFFIDGLRRVDRLRRLIEYRRSLKRDRAVVRCAEHVRIADLLLVEQRAEASEALREHLTTVSKEKTDTDAPGDIA
ncbi:GntR family transcriptional regulator [Streptomyces luomodiensis]|uniref:GntR family transcriptional regulator n=1 Tax=Streptomyces luomodiensis TaxID=3026192 RepID=A0ABY9V627_9ACTN|nr:GntR family transcriptional regulator [Streptomyces sp. SCA4-21]WNE99757.1 GntR family transcriptional regulator [Streptomyces sp. SCA4-21]